MFQKIKKKELRSCWALFSLLKKGKVELAGKCVGSEQKLYISRSSVEYYA